MTAPRLQFYGSFGRAEPLGSVDLELHASKTYCLTGPNGSGKSTLLDTLAGHLEPLSGRVNLLPHDEPVGSRTAAGKIVHVNDPIFLPDLSVGEHIDLLQRRLGRSFSEELELWALEPLLALPPRSLSSGQRQRCFLAMQLYQPCEVILVDEPERHLDSDWTAFIATELRELAESGRCVVTASHSAEIRNECDEEISL